MTTALERALADVASTNSTFSKESGRLEKQVLRASTLGAELTTMLDAGDLTNSSSETLDAEMALLHKSEGAAKAAVPQRKYVKLLRLHLSKKCQTAVELGRKLYGKSYNVPGCDLMDR